MLLIQLEAAWKVRSYQLTSDGCVWDAVPDRERMARREPSDVGEETVGLTATPRASESMGPSEKREREERDREEREELLAFRLELSTNLC